MACSQIAALFFLATQAVAFQGNVMSDGQIAYSNKGSENAERPKRWKKKRKAKLLQTYSATVDAGGKTGKGGKGGSSINVEFGGSKHGTNPGDSYGKYLTRPETVKSTACNSNGCQPCTNPTSCFHGVTQSISGWRGKWGLQAIDVPAGTPFTHYMVEVWADCADHETATWYLWTSRDRVSNGALTIIINEEKDGRAQTRNVKTNWIPGSSGGEYVTIDNVKDARVQVVFNPDRTVQSKASFWLEVYKADEAVDSCMGMKACLRGFGDGKRDSFELRNSNTLEKKCLQGITAGMSQNMIKKCRIWEKCVKSAGSKPHLLALMSAAAMVYPALIEENQTQHQDDDYEMAMIAKEDGTRRGAPFKPQTPTRAQLCIDPSKDDPESWDCDCQKTWSAWCRKPANAAKPLNQCLNDVMCGHDKICCSWKRRHCPRRSRCRGNSFIDVDSSGANHTHQSAMVQRSVASFTQKSGTVSDLDGSVDDALAGKCTG